jgi:myosin heavy subunit
MEALLADDRYRLQAEPEPEPELGGYYSSASSSSRRAAAARSAHRGRGEGSRRRGDHRRGGADSSAWREHMDREELEQLGASLPRAQGLSSGPSVLGGERVARITDATEDQLDHLRDTSDDAVVQHLAERYHRGLVYSALGDVLLVVNPFGPPPSDVRPGAAFANWAADAIRPHPFATADKAYRAMRAERRARSVLINGVSGSGKSFVCRQLLAQWASLPGSVAVGRKLVHANLLLDQFSNAKTVRNDDSSRNSKVIHAHFDRASGRLVGARFVTLQLDQGRLLAPPTSDRNYHVFYQLCFGAGDDERAWLGVGSVKTYRLLNQSSCFQAGVRDENDHTATRSFMKEYLHRCRSGAPSRECRVHSG